MNMKRLKFIILLTIFCLILSACSTAQPAPMPTATPIAVPTPTVTVGPTATPQPTPMLEPSPTPQSTQEKYYYVNRDIYLYQRPDQSRRFNAALAAYNQFLKDAGKNQDYGEGISRYALYDFNHDDIPELICSIVYQGALFGGYDIYTYEDNEVKFLLHPVCSIMNGGDISFMENGMIGTTYVSTTRYYNFYKINDDNSYERIEFGEDYMTRDRTDYWIGDKKVTKQEYDKFSRYYLAEFENTAHIAFREMYDVKYY